MKKTLQSQIYHWLKRSKISVSMVFLKQQILSHPDYPSLLCITDTLDELGIENAALVVDKEKLHEIPIPFIAHTGIKGGEFILVTDLKKLLIKNPEFEKNWDGTVVVAEKPEGWKNAENENLVAKEKKKKQFLWLSAAGVVLFVTILLVNQFSWQNFGLLLAAIAGLGVAVLIVQYELGISNEI